MVPSGGCNPDNWRLNQKVDYYCSYQEYNSSCNPFDQQTISEFQAGMQQCMQHAFDVGFTEMLLSPHLDDGTRTNHWRNMLVFDPLVKDSHGFSYHDIMLQPLAAAATAAATALQSHPGKSLWFGLQGEMGATVFFYPESYQQIVQRLHQDLQSSAVSSTVKFGVLLAGGLVPGVINHGWGSVADAPLPHTQFSGIAEDPVVLPFQQWPFHDVLSTKTAAAQQLINSLDFIGVSIYAKGRGSSITPDTVANLTNMHAELAAMGVSIGGKILIWSEFGIGGGISRCGDMPAITASDTLRWPVQGIKFSYTQKLDPWKNYLGVNAQVPARDAMRQYFKSGLTVLEGDQVAAAFLWNLVSWDIQGVNPSSNSSEGSYADPAVVAMIQQHNAKYHA
eukprot:jgi/Chrzof1/2082/Cz11g02040.t1